MSSESPVQDVPAAATSAEERSLPEVTVVIPTHNRRRLIEQAARAALTQEDVAVELLVVDDGSDDGTAELVEAIEDPRLRLLRVPEAGGVSRARNRGLAEARGAWVAFLDDDDLWAPDYLRRQVDAATWAGASLTYARTIVVDERRSPLELRPVPEPEGILSRLLERNVIGAPCGVVLRTDLVRELGGFDTSLSLLADWDMWIRVAAAAPVAACHEVLVGYTKHDSNMHRVVTDASHAEFRYLVHKHGSLITEYEAAPDGRFSLVWAADAGRRSGRRRQAARAYLTLWREYGQTHDLLRAVGVLFGERLMTVGRRSLTVHEVPAIGWLDSYR